MILDKSEAFSAAVAGLMRRFKAIERGAQNNSSYKQADPLSTDVHGAIAEALVAKTLGLYWNPATYDRSRADVGFDIEVRSTPNPNGKLAVRPADKDSRKFYLVVGLYPDIKIVGWIYGKEAKQDKYWRDKDEKNNKIEHPHWAVPQCDLKTDLIEFSY